MQRVEDTAILNWTNESFATPNCINIVCPHCRDKVSFTIRNKMVEGATKLACGVGNCPACKQEISLWTHRPNDKLVFVYLYPPLLGKAFDQSIETTSPAFCKIYNEALTAEQLELFEICGMGYRKAIEFLIKDYLISLNPEQANEIKDKSLGSCINNDVKNENVKEVARRTAWLGNDETHYVRRWEEKNLDDLKALVELTIYWITQEVRTKEILAGMPEPKK